MIPTAMLLNCFGQLQAVSTRGETVKLLTIKAKLPAVSPFHDFGEQGPRNFNRDRPPDLKIPGALPPENDETAKQTAIYLAISNTCLFHPGLKRLETA